MMKYSLFFIAFIIPSLALTCITEVEGYVQFKKINAVEGQVVELEFPFPCESSIITIQYGTQNPFFVSNKQKSEWDFPRNYFLQYKNDTATNQCTVHLTINPTTRDDEGGYTLFAYMNGKWLLEHVYRIRLTVDSTSGRAWCSISDVYIEGEWLKLHCTAAVINASQGIRCYQDGSMLPPLTLTPTEESGNIKQGFLAKETGYVFCCSSATDQIDRCQCMDCAWDPIHNTPIYNITDPCPPISTPPDKPPDGSTPPSWQTTEPQFTTPTGIQDCDAGHLEYMYIAIGILSSMLLISIIINFIQCKQTFELKTRTALLNPSMQTFNAAEQSVEIRD